MSEKPEVTPDPAGIATDAGDVSLARLYFLRLTYLMIGVGMGVQVWPSILARSGNWEPMPAVVKCMLGALTLLALVGLRYPLKMLPVLLWELLWKTIWLLAVALPAWRAGPLDAATTERLFEMSFVVIVYAALPWRYVIARFAGDRGDRWRSRRGG